MSQKSSFTIFCESCGSTSSANPSMATPSVQGRSNWSWLGKTLVVLLAINAALLAREDLSELKTLIASIPALIRTQEIAQNDALDDATEDVAPIPNTFPNEISEPDLALQPELTSTIDAPTYAPSRTQSKSVDRAEVRPKINQEPLAPTISTNEKPQEIQEPTTLPFDRTAILADHLGRIDDTFAIPDGLRDRVAFWFDVYSKYNDNNRIIHHANYPWIVYKVVDVTEIINAPIPRRRWLRNVKADKFVDLEVTKIRAAISSIAKRGFARKSNSYEVAVETALRGLGGDLRKQARRAQGNTRIQLGQKAFFEEGLRISHRYLGEMEKEFADRNLPIELSRLPLVESSFNKAATSKVGAAGIWQFMGNTGKKFMIVNDFIDERRSPFKATDAAARLLKENHMILHRSWPLALTAWNHGPGGVRRAIRATGTKDLSKIVGKYQTKNFNFASSNFYCEFLAALHASMYNDQIWGPSLNMEAALQTHVVKLPRAYRPSHLMKVIGLDKEEVLLHNPDIKVALRHDRALPRGFHFHVPQTVRPKVERLFAQEDTNSARTKKRSRS